MKDVDDRRDWILIRCHSQDAIRYDTSQTQNVDKKYHQYYDVMMMCHVS